MLNVQGGATRDVLVLERSERLQAVLLEAQDSKDLDPGPEDLLEVPVDEARTAQNL